MGKILLCLALVFACVCLQAETLVTEAKILEVTERGFILKVGTEPLVVEDSPETRLWKSSLRAERESFGKEEAVGVRIKTDCDPPLLREMADLPTWKWLTQLRKEPVKATIEKVENKSMRVKLADGRPFEFRFSDKTDVRLAGKEASVTDLEPGKTVFLKGRLLPTLDTWLEKVWDEPIPVKATAAKGKKATKPAPIPASGKLEAMVLVHIPNIKIFDIMIGSRTLHITYRLTTKFTYEGRAVKPDALAKFQECVVYYTRDKTGRILASKVDLFRPRGG